MRGYKIEPPPRLVVVTSASDSDVNYASEYYKLISYVWAFYCLYAFAKLLVAIAKDDDERIHRFTLTARHCGVRALFFGYKSDDLILSAEFLQTEGVN